MHTTSAVRATPAHYLHLNVPSKMVASEYRDQLNRFFENPSGTDSDRTPSNPYELFLQFSAASAANATLTSSFYSAVREACGELRKGLGGTPKRWHDVMRAIADTSVNDPTIQKFVRDLILAKAIPVLVKPQATVNDLQAASDILTVAGKYENLADAIDPAHVRPVVKWHLANAKHNFSWAATRLTDLRTSAPFVEVIADIENKHGIHVHGEHLPNDATRILIAAFDQANHSVDFSMTDTTLWRHNQHHQPRPLAIGTKSAEPYRAQIERILVASTDLPKQGWVEPIATTAYCELN